MKPEELGGVGDSLKKLLAKKCAVNDPVLGVASVAACVVLRASETRTTVQRECIANGRRSDAGSLPVPESVLSGTLRRAELSLLQFFLHPKNLPEAPRPLTIGPRSWFATGAA
jgi:hypothetical protein